MLDKLLNYFTAFQLHLLCGAHFFVFEMKRFLLTYQSETDTLFAVFLKEDKIICPYALMQVHSVFILKP